MPGLLPLLHPQLRGGHGHRWRSRSSRSPPSLARWEKAFAYIADQPDLEDIVISGGDSYNLKADHLQLIGERLLRMPNIRRIRYATKGLCVLPQKILSDHAWTDALTRVVELGRSLHKDVVVHTHFNHPARDHRHHRRTP